MFDKVIFHIRINFMRDAGRIAEKYHLAECTERGVLYYKSSPLGNISGIMMKIKGNELQVSCSLHKLYHKALYGTLDNAGMFTMQEAYETAMRLFSDLEIPPENVRVTYYEIGVSMPMPRPPAVYISQAKAVGDNPRRELFTDANFQKFRQKTTEKSRTKKKFFKMYDKSYEARDKGRKVINNVLRIETVYKRQNIRFMELFSAGSLDKLTDIFTRDWVRTYFGKTMLPRSGIRRSEEEKARGILTMGKDEYLRVNREEYKAGRLTPKQWRVIREFVRDWDEKKAKFKLQPTSEETDFQRVTRLNIETAKKHALMGTP